jgi:hypothetical protein
LAKVFPRRAPPALTRQKKQQEIVDSLEITTFTATRMAATSASEETLQTPETLPLAQSRSRSSTGTPRGEKPFESPVMFGIIFASVHQAQDKLIFGCIAGPPVLISIIMVRESPCSLVA